MPDYQHIAQYPDGRQVGWDGTKWVPITTQSFPTGALQTKPGGPILNAFQEEHPLRAIPATILQSFGIDPAKIESAQSTIDALKSGGNQAVDAAGEQMFESLAKAGPLAPIHLLGKGIIGVEQGIKEGSQKAYEGYKNRDRYGMTEGLTQVASSLGQLALLKEGKEKGERGFHRGSQFVAGVGSDVVEKLAREHADLTRRLTAENAEELTKARDVERQKFGEVESKRAELAKQTQEENQSALARARDTERQQIDQLEKEHAAAKEEARIKTEASKAGVAERERLTNESQKTAQVLGNSLQTLREQETAVAKAMYPEIGGIANQETIQKGLQTAIDSNLRGSDKLPSTLARIIKETSEVPGKSTGPAIQGRTLDLSNPNDLAAYQRYKTQGVFSPEEVARIEGRSSKLDFERLHGYYSELGREMFNRDLPGDERAADAAARKVIGDEMERMASRENKSYRFNVAQRNWAKLENTWYNTAVKNGSPIARVLQAIDPVTKQVRPQYVQSILSDPKWYQIAQEMLSRYKGTGNAQSALQLMMENLQEARRLPKVAKEFPGPGPIEYPKSTSVALKETPKGPEYPKSIPLNLKEVPGPFDPVAARRSILQGQVPTGVTPGLFWRYALLRNLMRKLTNIPSVQDYLSQNPK